MRATICAGVASVPVPQPMFCPTERLRGVRG